MPGAGPAPRRCGTSRTIGRATRGHSSRARAPSRNHTLYQHITGTQRHLLSEQRRRAGLAHVTHRHSPHSSAVGDRYPCSAFLSSRCCQDRGTPCGAPKGWPGRGGRGYRRGQTCSQQGQGDPGNKPKNGSRRATQRGRRCRAEQGPFLGWGRGALSWWFSVLAVKDASTWGRPPQGPVPAMTVGGGPGTHPQLEHSQECSVPLLPSCVCHGGNNPL